MQLGGPLRDADETETETPAAPGNAIDLAEHARHGVVLSACVSRAYVVNRW